jgi:hypothetical protein
MHTLKRSQSEEKALSRVLLRKEEVAKKELADDYRKRFDEQERRIRYLESQLRKKGGFDCDQGNSQERREQLYGQIIKQKNKEIEEMERER